jgi:hypothetical protein
MRAIIIQGGFMFFSVGKKIEKSFILNFVSICPIFIILFLFPGSVLAEDTADYGSRYEFGIGGSYSQEYKQPHWTSGNYNIAMLTGAIRLYKGLAVQGGVDIGRGGKPISDSLSYGKDYILNPNKGTYNGSSWVGLRYEFPMKQIKKDILGIHSIYAFGGFCWSDYGIQSTEWIYNGLLYTDQSKVAYRFAKLKGKFAAVAARWRVDTGTGKDEGPLLGSYGADLGIKYVHYRAGEPEVPGLEKSRDGFNNLQAFLILFMKFKIFE